MDNEAASDKADRAGDDSGDGAVMDSEAAMREREAEVVGEDKPTLAADECDVDDDDADDTDVDTMTGGTAMGDDTDADDADADADDDDDETPAKAVADCRCCSSFSAVISAAPSPPLGIRLVSTKTC